MTYAMGKTSGRKTLGLKTLGLCPKPCKGLLEEKQRFATGSCNATAPLARKNFN